jgi:LCP family protein required for cell wall assembly
VRASEAPTVRFRAVHRRSPVWVRVLVAAASALVLLVSGYAWSVTDRLSGVFTAGPTTGGGTDGATDILLVGLDSRTDSRGEPLPRAVLDALDAGDADGQTNTDTLILVRIPDDPERPAVAVSIPRDSYVDVPGFGTHKVNSAFARGSAVERRALTAQGVTGAELNRRSDAAGRETLLATIRELTGVGVDHYAEVNLAGFAGITDALGGVPVCLAAPAKDAYSGADFAAGPQTVSGAAALAFVRQRHGLPGGDLDRVKRQQAFLAGLAHQTLSAGTLTDPLRVSDLVGAVGDSVVLDAGWSIPDVLRRASALSGIEFRTIPTGRTDLRTPSDGVAVQVDPAVVQGFLADLSTPPDAPTEAPLVVDVANGTARTGLAARVSDTLDDAGYVPGTVGNADPVRHTEVAAGPDTLDRARAVADRLGAPLVSDPALAAGRVRVTLGRDYAGPEGTTSQGATDSSGETDAAAAAAAAPEITTDGIPCVN